jgi:adenosylcobinamide-GDP ribazoletransferase
MGQGWRLFVVACRFLTRLPLPDPGWRDGDLRRAAPAFPVVGVVVGGLAVGIYAALAPLWGGAVGAIAAVLAMVALTGGLHEDGLADTADGLWGGHDPARRLEIMRDSRVGTYGIVAVTASLALRAVLLAPLGTAGVARAVISGAVVGRAAMVVVAAWLPAATAGRGSQVVGAPGAGGSALVTTVVAATLGVAVGPWAVIPLVAALAAVVGVGALARRRLGGVTGDVLGATGQVVEIVVIAAVAALVRHGLGT